MNDGRREAWAGPIYLDASALVKLFLPGPDSDALNQALTATLLTYDPRRRDGAASQGLFVAPDAGP